MPVHEARNLHFKEKDAKMWVYQEHAALHSTHTLQTEIHIATAYQQF